jgi:hypothetical protein
MTSALEWGEWSASHPGRNLPPPPRKDPVPIVQEAGWAPGPVWTGAGNLALTGIWSADHPAGSQSLYRLSYRAHLIYSDNKLIYYIFKTGYKSSVLFSTKCHLFHNFMFSVQFFTNHMLKFEYERSCLEVNRLDWLTDITKCSTHLM